MSKTRSAFTIVEILIVVIVLGILAAIVVPQFSDASMSAKDNSLESNLQIIRGQINLYRLEHDAFPTLESFTAQMTGKTGSHGPYLQSIPSNPCWTGVPNMANSVGNGVAGTSAWYYSETTGEFRENHQ